MSQCMKCGQSTVQARVCDACKLEVQRERTERQYRWLRQAELQEDRAWANARFHPLWFLLVGWWAAVLLLAAVVSSSGIPLLFLLFRSVRRFVFHVVGYY